jgi:hypothetical protein
VQVTTTAVVSQPSGLTGTDAMIEVEDLSKAFGSVQALVGVSLHVQAGRTPLRSGRRSGWPASTRPSTSC